MRKKAVHRGCLSFLHRWDGQCSTNLAPEGREMGEGKERLDSLAPGRESKLHRPDRILSVRLR